MKIEIKLLQDNYEKLSDIVEEYLNTFNSYYNETNFISNYWKSAKANYFSYVIEEEKKANKKFYFELSSLCSLYYYIIDKYSDFQNRLSINEEGNELLVNKFLDNDINNIINKYETIYSASSIVLEKINIQKNKIRINKEKLLNYKDEVKELYTKIKDIELSIKRKISEVVVQSINETTHEDKSLGEVDELSYDVSKLEMIYEKIKMYRNDFENNYLDLDNIFKKLSENYNTSNSVNLEELKSILLNKYSIVKKNINNNLELLKKNIDSMRESSNIMRGIAADIVVSTNE